MRLAFFIDFSFVHHTVFKLVRPFVLATRDSLRRRMSEVESLELSDCFFLIITSLIEELFGACPLLSAKAVVFAAADRRLPACLIR